MAFSRSACSAVRFSEPYLNDFEPLFLGGSFLFLDGASPFALSSLSDCCSCFLSIGERLGGGWCFEIQG